MPTHIATENPGKEGVEAISGEVIKELPTRHPELAFIIGGTFRPGLQEFYNEVESRYFDPNTERNKDFELFLTKFPRDTDMIYATMVVPLNMLESIKHVAAKHKFKINRGMPHMISGEGMQSFPINDGPNVFTVEGINVGFAAIMETKKEE